jgi:hypothetical protein
MMTVRFLPTATLRADHLRALNPPDTLDAAENNGAMQALQAFPTFTHA